MAGERLHRVEPLDAAVDGDASHLFARYAELARPGFALDDLNRGAVARICRRVDGLPLGIELAAARVRQLPPHALAAAMDEGLALVTGGASRPPRQRDLHALTAWSVDLLAPHQQQLLELLAVFPGGVDLDTVARFPVADGVPDPVTDVLELVDASLVRLSDDDRPRVTLLETVREHALARLTAAGRVATVRDTHLAVHLDLARRLHPRTASQDRVAPVVLRERANLDAALDHALTSGPDGVEAAAEIVVSLADSWHQLGGRAFEHIRRIAAALPADSPHRGWMTYWDFRRTWDTEVDEQVVLRAVQTAEGALRAEIDPAPLAALLGYGTDLGIDIGLGATWGVTRAQEAVAIARDLGEDWLLARVDAALARALVDAGRPDAARSPLAEAQQIATRRKDLHRLDLLTLTEAGLVAGEGRREEAWLLGRGAARGLVAVRHDGTLWATCSTLALLLAEERPADAARLVGTGLAALSRIGSIPTPADLDRVRGSIAPALDALGRDAFDAHVDEGRAWTARRRRRLGARPAGRGRERVVVRRQVTSGDVSFTGFPVAALDFYDDLEMDNTKSFWEANKPVWKDAVEAPMKALVGELEPEFGPAKVFRPYRDVRFAKDKTPYKTHQGAYVGAGPSTGWYVEISARGTRVGGGFYDADGPRLAAIREAMADEKSGKALERLLKRLEKDGFEIGGDRLKTSPRGYDADHPRIELLRCKQLIANKSYGFESDAIDAGLVDRVREDWKTLRPLVSWLRAIRVD